MKPTGHSLSDGTVQQRQSYNPHSEPEREVSQAIAHGALTPSEAAQAPETEPASVRRNRVVPPAPRYGSAVLLLHSAGRGVPLLPDPAAPPCLPADPASPRLL